jgi:chaperonin cofactor prefoldin
MDQELKQHLEAMEGRMEGRMEKLEERLTEKMRDMQTELLRGFAAFSEGQTIRLRGRGGSIEP